MFKLPYYSPTFRMGRVGDPIVSNGIEAVCNILQRLLFMVPGMDRRNSAPPISQKDFCASALFFFEEYRTMKDASGIGMIPPFWSGSESLNSKTTHDPDIISDTLHTQTSTPTRESHTQQRSE